MATYYHDTVLADGPEFVALGVVGGGGTVVGSPTAIAAPTADTGDAGYQFDGSTEYVITGYAGSPAGSGAFSIEFWVKPAANGGVLVGASGPSGHADDLNIALSASSGNVATVSATLGGGGTNYAIFGLNTVVLGHNVRVGVWNHVVVTFNGSYAKMYVNGVRSAIQGAAFAFDPAGVSALCLMALGQPGAGAPLDFCDAAIADAAFYAFPLTIERVIAHYAARAGTPAYPSAGSFTGDYYPTIIGDNPIAYYRCDETAGALAVDRSGNGHHGSYGAGSHTLNEPGAIYDGDPSIALQETPPGYWDATSANLSTPITSASGSTQFSVEAWVFVTTLPDVGVICATMGQTPTHDGPGFSLTIGTSGKVTGSVYASPSATSSVTTPSALPSGQWNYVVMTFDLTAIILYVNGAPVASTAAAFAGAAWNSNLTWGVFPVNYNADAGQLLATLDEPAIYNYPLTPGQVYTHYEAGLGPLPAPIPAAVANDDQHYFDVRIYDKRGQLVDVPKADIDSLSLLDQLNGGSTTSTMSFIRDFNNIGAIEYLYSVLVWIWNGRIAKPIDPTWNGYYVDIDQEKTRTLGKITVHLEGDAKQLDRAAVYEDVNPLVDGNPPLDAADYMRHLYTVYAPPGYCALSCPPTLFPLLPGQYEMMQLGDVIDTVLKTGRDDLGNLIIWRMNRALNLQRTLLIEPDQNPNTVVTAKFHHVFVNEMCAKYLIRTKYSDLWNIATVQGGQDYITGLPVVGSYKDVDSVAEWGPWEQILSVWSLISSDACTSYAQAWLDIHGNPQANGEIELHAPDPTIRSGQWVQVWENASSIKQMRIASVRWEVGRTRIKQTLYPTAPTPYLDLALYKLGMNKVRQNVVSELPVNTQNNFVRSGGTASRS